MCQCAIYYECERESKWEYDQLSLWVKERKNICAAVQMSDLKIFIIWECSSISMSPQRYYIKNKWQRHTFDSLWLNMKRRKASGHAAVSSCHVITSSACPPVSRRTVYRWRRPPYTCPFLSKYLKSFWWASPLNWSLRDFNFSDLTLFKRYKKENTFRLILAWKLPTIPPQNMEIQIYLWYMGPARFRCECSPVNFASCSVLKTSSASVYLCFAIFWLYL